ncbi:mandelate racemase/muconate lactonizing enzyme family protein [Neolewinella persica]|uniref:mandelate racemase/muconate lactonizing enzyme family protein n=1 Tax=Neolewinella persica TaxID=70998 RepID=UPI00036B4CD0|nr:dipeptide epimerase [Neolewinella persica]
MKLTRLTLYPSPIALTAPFVISLGPLTHANNVLVRAETDTGLVGWGEASPFPTIHGETMAGAMAVGRFLAEQLLGADPADPATFTSLLDRAVAGNSCIKSAFDIACYDLASQAAGVPLYAYLGGKNDKELHTDYTVSLSSVEEMVAKARWVKDQGFPVIKLKLGAGPQDAERVRMISQAVGKDVPLRLDANQGWTPDLAIELLCGMADLNIQHCEAPIPRHDFLELPRIRAASPIPIMADESCWDHRDARRLIDLKAIDKINIKVSKSGGLYKALKIMRIAEAAGVPLQIGGFLESRLGFTAAAHLALCSPQAVYYDFDTPLMQSKDPMAGGMTYGPGGRIILNDESGLGVRPLAAYLDKLDAVVVDS